MSPRARAACWLPLFLVACTSVEDCLWSDNQPPTWPTDTGDSGGVDSGSDTGDTSDAVETGETDDSAPVVETGDTGCVPTGEEQPYNGLDDDCDPGTPDDDLDGDGDGVETDCDDSDATVGADAAEECHYRLTASLRIEGLADGYLGSGLLRADDLDGDGVAELVVGAADDQGWAGTVRLYAGAGLAVGAVLGEADALQSWTGAASYDRLGGAEAMAQLNDLDGDGARELLLACPAADPGGFTSTGEVYLLASSSLALDGGGGLASATATVSLQGANTADRFGDAIGVVDLDGDGVDDVLVGCTGDDSAWDGAGSVALFANVDATAATISVDDAAVRLTGTYLEGLGGGVLRGAGDLDGDGREDLLVGSPDASGTGVVYLVAGGDMASGPIAELAFATITGAASGDEMGHSGRSLGDLDGDGDHELVLQALKGDVLATNGGGLYLWHGGAELAGQIDVGSAAVAWGSDTGLARAGEPLQVVDVNADGVLDLLTATPWNASGGRVSLLDGATWEGWRGGDLGDDARLWVATHEADGLGTGLLATDLDGSGELDLLVGAPSADGGRGVVAGWLR
jgi:hypothetical protein